ncbi:large subunit ribosomal protein L30e [Enteropsectra breve]|nr:large subunit ribosomal protein L30e [Enteropsectra breve]
MSRKTSKQNNQSTQLALALRTGKYFVGYKKALKSLISGSAKCVVVASNFPKTERTRLEYYCGLAKNTPIKFYEGNNRELATAAKFNFLTSVITILDQGEAELYEIPASN